MREKLIKTAAILSAAVLMMTLLVVSPFMVKSVKAG